MWRVVYRAPLRQGKRVCQSLVNAQCRRNHALASSYGNKTFASRIRGNGAVGQFHQHRWSSGSVTVGAEPFLNGSSGSYVEAMYESWQKDRNSVHKVSEC